MLYTINIFKFFISLLWWGQDSESATQPTRSSLHHNSESASSSLNFLFALRRRLPWIIFEYKNTRGVWAHPKEIDNKSRRALGELKRAERKKRHTESTGELLIAHRKVLSIARAIITRGPVNNKRARALFGIQVVSLSSSFIRSLARRERLATKFELWIGPRHYYYYYY